MNHGQWTKGKPIPVKYRNRMYAWEGGGYDGCFWEMNQGVVTDGGHWDPFHSTGRNGLDLDEWHRGRVRDLKRELGFSVDRYGPGADVEAWYASVKHALTEEARGKYYGEKYFDNPEYYDPNAEPGKCFVDKHREEVEAYVGSRIAEHSARYTTYRTKLAEIDREWHNELDEVFMDQIKAQRERPPNLHSRDYHGDARDRWEEYPLDDESIRKSCERFCREYSGTVGVMAGVLDALAERGYEVWCTCSDCGKQFQLSDYEKFSYLIDGNNYHGDGGIGCVFTRIQCEECHRDTECPKCYEPNLPTRQDIESGHAYDGWTFRERFIGVWVGVCDCCACNFFYEDEHKHWDEELDNLEEIIDKGKKQLDHYIEAMKEIGGRSEAELETLRNKNWGNLATQWAKMINDMRDKMENDVVDHFSDCADWASRRITVTEVKDYV